ncbi:unnamed protein product, partial [Polarella glacialis]
ACSGALELCQVLLEARADPRRRNPQGLTAFDLAKQAEGSQRPAVCALLREAAAQLASEEPPFGGSERRPLAQLRAELRAAAKACDLQAVEATLEALNALGPASKAEVLRDSDGSGRSAEARDAFGRTPLELAAESACAAASDEPEPVIAICSALLSQGPPRETVELEAQTAESPVGRAIIMKVLAPMSRCVSGRKLGLLPEAPLLAECERLRGLGREELRREWQKASRDEGLPSCEGCDDEGAEQLASRLKQLAIWRALPVAALQDECRVRASQVIATSEAQTLGRVLDKAELIEALAVASWGGLTRCEALLDSCIARGIPVDKLSSQDDAKRLLRSIEELDKMTLVELKAECRKIGVAPDLPPTKAALVRQLSEVLLWGELPLSALRDLCKDRGLPIRGDQRRADLVSLLRENSWTARGVPIQRLADETVAQKLLDQAELLAAKGIGELQAECRRKEVPFDVFGEQVVLVACLTDLLVWEEMSTDSLQLEYEQRYKWWPRAEVSGDSSQERPPLLRRLVEARLVEAWKQAGMDKRITTFQATEAILREIRRFHGLSKKSLQEESLRRGLPAEVDLDRLSLLERLTMPLVWEQLTLQELRKDCQLRDVSFTALRSRVELEQKRELVERLFSAVCKAAWAAKGLPVKRLASMAAAARVVGRTAQLAEMSFPELQAAYRALGLAPEAGEPPGARRDLLQLLECVALWQELPLKELQKDCRELEVSTSSLTNVRLSEAEHRVELLQRLCLGVQLKVWSAQGIPVKRLESMQAAVCVVQRVQQLRTMDEASLRKEYACLGLPEDAGQKPAKQELMDRLQQVARWQQLPLRELQRECKDSDISTGGVSAKLNDEDQKSAFVERLVLAKFADLWVARSVPIKRLCGISAAAKLARELARLQATKEDALQLEYSNLGLPKAAFKMPELKDALARLKLVALRRELPVHELRRECQDAGASTGGLSGLCDEAVRRELLERLLLVSCADAWRSRGVPLQRLASIRSAEELALQHERLDGLADGELLAEYKKLDIKSQARVPDKSAVQVLSLTLTGRCPSQETRLSFSFAAGGAVAATRACMAFMPSGGFVRAWAWGGFFWSLPFWTLGKPRISTNPSTHQDELMLCAGPVSVQALAASTSAALPVPIAAAPESGPPLGAVFTAVSLDLVDSDDGEGENLGSLPAQPPATATIPVVAAAAPAAPESMDILSDEDEGRQGATPATPLQRTSADGVVAAATPRPEATPKSQLATSAFGRRKGGAAAAAQSEAAPAPTEPGTPAAAARAARAAESESPAAAAAPPVSTPRPKAATAAFGRRRQPLPPVPEEMISVPGASDAIQDSKVAVALPQQAVGTVSAESQRRGPCPNADLEKLKAEIAESTAQASRREEQASQQLRASEAENRTTQEEMGTLRSKLAESFACARQHEEGSELAAEKVQNELGSVRSELESYSSGMRRKEDEAKQTKCEALAACKEVQTLRDALSVQEAAAASAHDAAARLSDQVKELLAASQVSQTVSAASDVEVRQKMDEMQSGQTEALRESEAAKTCAEEHAAQKDTEVALLTKELAQQRSLATASTEQGHEEAAAAFRKLATTEEELRSAQTSSHESSLATDALRAELAASSAQAQQSIEEAKQDALSALEEAKLKASHAEQARHEATEACQEGQTLRKALLAEEAAVASARDAEGRLGEQVKELLAASEAAKVSAASDVEVRQKMDEMQSGQTEALQELEAAKTFAEEHAAQKVTEVALLTKELAQQRSLATASIEQGHEEAAAAFRKLATTEEEL